MLYHLQDNFMASRDFQKYIFSPGFCLRFICDLYRITLNKRVEPVTLIAAIVIMIINY